MVDPVSAAAASAAVSKSVAKATEEDSKEKDLLLKAAQESGYLDPAARSLAKRMAVKQQIRLKIWQPLGRLVGIQKDYFNDHFNDEMAARMADVPEDQVVTPRTSIAGPAIQGISYTVEEPELKEMYLNLLATASDARVRDTAHPSFAEVIRQLNTEEAKALTDILTIHLHAIIEVHLKLARAEDPSSEGYNTLATHLLNWMSEGHQVHVPVNAMYVDNWIRLGLVSVSYTTTLTDKARYAWAETTPIVVDSRDQYDTEDFTRVEVQEGVLQVTNFGRRFHEVVIASGTREPAPAAQEADIE
ncbi:DUF4393 domain-containing protein [Rhodococcus sp. 06-1460-1B]|uniref:DUF4393 domain-containing protein n=1 Tax=Rhodococcus sp. 06-1460-1B TaxID=2022501 RepID=UPI000B9AC5F4|nr:DUF4393 domain-containing protein [Rhodococcus sp. 06-1460-1B]OZD61763.1 hypothetical protein CH268_12530 [Rhodococcus sp. 06-1460-1B]